MRVRLLDISDKRPHSKAPAWGQADLDNPKPQKIAQTFFAETQTRPDGSPILTYGGKHSSPDFPWHQPNPSGSQGFNEYSDADVSMSLRVWMADAFGDAFPITESLVRDTLWMLAATCVRAVRDRPNKDGP